LRGDAQNKKGSAVSRGALMQGADFYVSIIMGMAPADSGRGADTA